MGTSAVFDTEWGWMGVSVSQEGIRRVVLPSKRPDEVARSLEEAGRFARDEADAGLSGLDEAELASDFASAVIRYLRGEDVSLSFPIDTRGLSPFQRKAMAAITMIPRGRTRSYAEVAREMGKPGAARAVGSACSANPVPLVVPCHRVVTSGGALGGFGGGTDLKRRLLELEGAVL